MVGRLEVLTGEIISIAALLSICLFLISYLARRVREVVDEFRKPYSAPTDRPTPYRLFYLIPGSWLAEILKFYDDQTWNPAEVAQIPGYHPIAKRQSGGSD
jgi:hypothetical protein